MAEAAISHLGPQIRRGLLVSSTPTAVLGFDCIAGGHPIPNAESERAGRRALELADSLGPDDVLLILLSGGASALMAVPAADLTLDDKRATTNQLLKAGADIYALNTVRKHLSAIKGGWLAAQTKATCRTLVISDVVGDDVSVIASGPTVGDDSTFQDALDVVQQFGGATAFPAAVVRRLQRGAAKALPDTPTGHDPRLARATTTIIGSRRDAMLGAMAEAEARGYHAIQIGDAVIGEARTAAAAHMGTVFATADRSPRPVCVVSSGETTVHVTGAGKGGRNQEFALAAALSLWGTGLRTSYRDPSPVQSTDPSPASPQGYSDPSLVLASVGTDGIDGPTDAAGAIADGSSISRALAAGLVPERFLSDNNTYEFFQALDDLIHTGPTGTNVGDIQVILLA